MVTAEGTVIHAHPGDRFTVRLDDNGEDILCYPGHRLSFRRERIAKGDRVLVEVPAHTPLLGRIVERIVGGK